METLVTTADLPIVAPILIVEDEPLEQQRFKKMVSQLGFDAHSVVLLPTLQDARGFLAKKNAHTPVLALVDLGLPDGNGRGLIAQLRSQYPELPIVVSSSWSSYGEIFDALCKGALGYVFKERDDLEISIVLHHILHGESAIEPIIAQRMLVAFSSEAEAPIERALPPKQLTALEKTILVKITEGLNNREIAEQLQLQRSAVNACIQNACRKLAAVARE